MTLSRHFGRLYRFLDLLQPDKNRSRSFLILINELELQIKEYGNLQTILNQLNTDLNNLNSDLNDINHQKINLESEIQQQKNIRIQLELEIQINQEKVSNLNNVRETQLAKIISLESTIFELNELTVELDDLTQYSNDLESQISLLNNSPNGLVWSRN